MKRVKNASNTFTVSTSCYLGTEKKERQSHIQLLHFINEKVEDKEVGGFPDASSAQSPTCSRLSTLQGGECPKSQSIIIC